MRLRKSDRRPGRVLDEASSLPDGAREGISDEEGVQPPAVHPDPVDGVAVAVTVLPVAAPSASVWMPTDAPALSRLAGPTQVSTPLPWPVPAPQAVSVFDLRASAAASASAASAPASAPEGDVRSLRVSITAWPDLAALPGVAIRLATAVPVTGATDATGLAVLETAVSGSQTLEVAFTPGAAAQAAADAAVTLQDAVAILRLLAGGSASADGAATLSPWARQAADFDGNGQVSLADAIGVLRHAVGQPAARPAWVFFDRDTGAGVASPAPVVDAQPPVSLIVVDGASDGSVSLAGVLRGDVDGSAAVGRFGLQALDNGAWTVKAGQVELSLAVSAGDLVLSAPDGQAARLPLGDMGVLDLAGAHVRVGDGAVDLATLGADRGLSDVGALTVDASLRLSLAQWQQALTDTTLLTGGGSVELVIHSQEQAQALLQTLDGARFDTTVRPALTVSVAVDPTDPQAAQTMASIDETLRMSVDALSQALGFAVPLTLSSGQTVWPGPPTLSVTLAGSEVSFGGSAAGTLHVQVDAQGRATFSRASTYGTEMAVSDTVVTGLFTKTLVGVEALSVTLAPSDAAVSYVLRAPQATSIEVAGATGGGVDEVVIRIADPRPGVLDARVLHLDTAGLAASGDTLTFRFEESARNVLSKPFDNDEVTLSPSSHVNAGFARLKVVAGIVDASGIDTQVGGYFPPDKSWDVSSGVVLSLQQLQQTAAVVSPSNSGALLVAVTEEEQAALEALLAEPGALALAGLTAGSRVDGAISGASWDFPPLDPSAVLPIQPLSASWGGGWPGLSNLGDPFFLA